MSSSWSRAALRLQELHQSFPAQKLNSECQSIAGAWMWLITQSLSRVLSVQHFSEYELVVFWLQKDHFMILLRWLVFHSLSDKQCHKSPQPAGTNTSPYQLLTPTPRHLASCETLPFLCFNCWIQLSFWHHLGHGMGAACHPHKPVCAGNNFVHQIKSKFHPGTLLTRSEPPS